MTTIIKVVGWVAYVSLCMALTYFTTEVVWGILKSLVIKTKQ